MVSMKEALTYLRENGDMSIVPNTIWNDHDIADFESATSMRINSQLAPLLKEIGQFTIEENDAFIVEYDDGIRSIHEVQILVESKEHMRSFHNMFIVEQDWPSRFTLPMVFFGTADAGHSYLLMDGRDPDNNAVYFWQRATDPFGTGNNARGIGKVADTLYEFFYNLKPREEL